MPDRLQDLPIPLQRRLIETARAQGRPLDTTGCSLELIQAGPPAAVPARRGNPTRGPAVVRARPAGSQPARRPGVPNATERAWGAELDLRLRAGELTWVGFEAITLKLADRLRYTPDWIARTARGETLAWEVKGFFRDDARAKLLTANEAYPWITFHLVRKVKGGGWAVERWSPIDHVWKR